MNQIITLLITSGGLGFANVLFLERIGVLSFDNRINNDRFLWLVIFSSLNYAIYAYFNNILITLAISVIATVVVAFSNNYKLENKIRKWIGKDYASDQNVWDLFWEDVKNTDLVLVFNETGSQILAFGTLYGNSRSVDINIDLVLNPLKSETEKYKECTIADILYWIASDNLKSKHLFDISHNKQYIVINFNN